ncbi:hypothetical protein F4781DRAFT_134565 [Annulohypoxylon bovei var. microspora]|nr:hypothetical protein F4781DRAFT_134565 [Annulohypoxylon bovei var. microspora]
MSNVKSAVWMSWVSSAVWGWCQRVPFPAYKSPYKRMYQKPPLQLNLEKSTRPHPPTYLPFLPFLPLQSLVKFLVIRQLDSSRKALFNGLGCIPYRLLCGWQIGLKAGASRSVYFGGPRDTLRVGLLALHAITFQPDLPPTQQFP